MLEFRDMISLLKPFEIAFKAKNLKSLVLKLKIFVLGSWLIFIVSLQFNVLTSIRLYKSFLTCKLWINSIHNIFLLPIKGKGQQNQGIIEVPTKLQGSTNLMLVCKKSKLVWTYSKWPCTQTLIRPRLDLLCSLNHLILFDKWKYLWNTLTQPQLQRIC